MSEPAPHPAALDPQLLLKQCDVQRSKASGPGGQHRNKVETAVELVHRPTNVSGAAGERRSQAENKRVALFRLRLNLAVEVRLPYALGEPPSPLWQSRCRGGRIAVNPRHEDFPAIIAEAMDIVATLRFDLRKAAAVLAITPTQLVRLLKDEPRAILWVNEQRSIMGLRPMR